MGPLRNAKYHQVCLLDRGQCTAIHARSSVESGIDAYLRKSFLRDPRLMSLEFFEVEATAIVVVDHVNRLLIRPNPKVGALA